MQWRVRYWKDKRTPITHLPNCEALNIVECWLYIYISYDTNIERKFSYQGEHPLTIEIVGHVELLYLVLRGVLGDVGGLGRGASGKVDGEVCPHDFAVHRTRRGRTFRRVCTGSCRLGRGR